MVKKILLFVLIGVVAVILLLQIDDPLDTEVDALIQSATPPSSSRAYLYLLGLHAPRGQDPAELGEQRFASTKQPDSDDPLPPDSSGSTDILTLPEGDLFCGLSDDGCLYRLFTSSDEVAAVVAQNQILLDRYRTFLSLNDFATLEEASLDELPVAYRHMMHGNRLALLSALQTAANGQSDQAVGELFDMIRALRHKLTTADTLITKALLTALIADNLDALSVLIQQHAFTTAKPLEPLSAAEKSMKKPVAHELRGMYSFYSTLDREADKHDPSGQWPHWVRRLFFKPNMSVNASYAHYRNALTLAELVPAEFAEFVDRINNKTVEELPHAWLRNYVGSQLVNIAGPAMTRYVELIFDLDAKITLFNASLSDPSMKSIAGKLPNPYFPSDAFAYRPSSKDAVCFESVSKAADNAICLALAMDRGTDTK